MRAHLACRSLLLLGVNLALAAAAVPALADDVVSLDVAQQARIGSLVLPPGTYVIRSKFSRENRNVLMVWSGNEAKFLGYVLANYTTSSATTPSDEFVYDGKDGQVVKAWKVAWKGSVYHFSAAPEPAALAGQAKTGSIVAAR